MRSCSRWAVVVAVTLFTAAPVGADLLAAIADFSNPVVQARHGHLDLVPPRDWVTGPGRGLATDYSVGQRFDALLRAEEADGGVLYPSVRAAGGR